MKSEFEVALERVWAHREEVVYPQLFGPTGNGVFVLSAELFTNTFKQQNVDPRWLTYGVFEFEPTPSRASWLYATSGASNPWELEPQEYAGSEFSGFGTELVFEIPVQAQWAIVALQRLLAFNILLSHGRYGDSKPLDYGHRVPLGGPIVAGSDIRHVIFGRPEHYPSSFVLESGRVDLLHAIGATEDERDYAKQRGSDQLVEMLKRNAAYPVTNPSRKSVVS